MHVLLIILSVCCLYPFLVILGSSFQSQEEIMRSGYRMLPAEFTLNAYRMLFADPVRLIDAYKVTIITTLIGTICGLAFVSSCGYVMSRKDYAYRKILSFYVFFTMLFNGGLVPTYILISRWLELKDNIFALILPGVCSAWNILLMKGFFMGVPTELIESAKLDGLGEFSAFVRIVMPISKPAFATVGLLLLLNYWNEWYFSMLYIESPEKVKLQYLLMSIMKNIEYLNSPEALEAGIVSNGQSMPTLSARMAMCIAVAGPILVVFPFFQKYFVKGMTVGAVKG
ncbi:MAG: carbohydrate ABC transporter permease [Clostridia bacterium]|nr:carbohydrate ABC transporter permease [Clostridia bacterium]